MHLSAFVQKFPVYAEQQLMQRLIQCGENYDSCVMWDVLLYMSCFYWLINKIFLANGLVKQSQAGNPNRYNEKK